MPSTIATIIASITRIVSILMSLAIGIRLTLNNSKMFSIIGININIIGNSLGSSSSTIRLSSSDTIRLSTSSLSPSSRL